MKSLRCRYPGPAMMKAAIVGGVLTAALATAGSANAAYTPYWQGALDAHDQKAGGSIGGYTATFNGSDGPSHKIEAAAHYPGGWSLHGSYVDGWDHACHAYDGSRELGGMIRNPHSVKLDWSAGLSYFAQLVSC